MLARYLFGEDVFISYARADGMKYAIALAERLSAFGFTCRLDVYQTEPSARLPAKLRRDLRLCSTFVLVATQAAAMSLAVDQEIEEFAATGGSLLVIGDHDTVRGARWSHRVAGLPAQAEAPTAIAEGQPSPAIVDVIRNSCTYRRRNERIRRTFGATVLGVIAGLVLLWFVSRQAIDAAAQRDEADRQASGSRTELTKQQAQLAAANAAQLEQQRKLESVNATLAISGRELQARRTELETQRQWNQAVREAGDLLERRLARNFSPGRDAREALKAAHTFQRIREESQAVAVLAENIGLLPRLERTLRQEGGFDTFAWTAAGRLVTGGKEGQLRMWEIPSGRAGASRRLSGAILGLKASPDGKRLLAVANAGAGVRIVEVLDSATLESMVPPVECPNARPDRATWAPKGDVVALVCGGGIHLWTLSTGKVVVVVAGGDVSRVQIAADGMRLAVVSLYGSVPNNRITFYGLPDGKAEARGMDACAGPSLRYSLDPNGRSYASTCDSAVTDLAACDIKMCSLDSGQQIAAPSVRTNFPVIDRLGRLIVVGDDQIGIWSSANSQKIGGWPSGKALLPEVSSDDRDRVTLVENGWASVFDIATAAPVGMFPADKDTSILGVFSAGRYALTTRRGGSEIDVWALKSLPLHIELRGDVQRFAFSADGRQLITGSPGRDGSLQLWDWPSGKKVASWYDKEREAPHWVQDWMVRALQHPPRAATQARIEALSADGQLRAWSTDSGIRVRDERRGNELALIRAGREDVAALAFSPDGSYVIAASVKGHVLRGWRWRFADLRSVTCEALESNSKSLGWRSVVGTHNGWRDDCRD